MHGWSDLSDNDIESVYSKDQLLTNIGGMVAATLVLLGSVLPQAHAQKSGGTLVMLVQPEPPSLASYLSTSGPIGLMAPKVYDGLLDYDKDLKAVPSLAESWEVSEDGLTVTFNLRKGVKWHDGADFTSADVQFTVMEVLKQVHPRGPNSFKEVTAIDTPDAHTAVFKLANPAPYMMRALAAYESPMVPFPAAMQQPDCTPRECRIIPPVATLKWLRKYWTMPALQQMAMV